MIALAATLLVAATCAPTRPGPPPGDAAPADTGTPDPATATEIRTMMEASAAAWNRGDLDGFLSDYAPDASFVTSRGLVHGRAQIREIYRRGYWREGAGPRDALRYEDFDIRRIGPETAIAFGRFILYDRGTGASTATGTFSLTLRRTAEGWEMVHDHSSADT